MNQEAKIRRLVALIAALFLVGCGDSEKSPEIDCLTAGTCVCASSKTGEPIPANISEPIPDADKSTITADPTSEIPADGTTKSTITVTARDGGNKSLANYKVRILVTGSDNFISPYNQSTDADGVATFTLASTTEETKIVSALITYYPYCPCGAPCVPNDEITLHQTVSIEFVSP